MWDQTVQATNVRRAVAWGATAPESRGMPNILASHSSNPAALAAHHHLYRTIMFGSSGLTRPEREAVAVCVSAANDCHY